MSSQINVYLSFNGNCRQAMQFYQECLGGELSFQMVSDFPLSKKMPQQMQECILHASLIKENLILMGTDMILENGLINGNAVSLLLNCSSEIDIKKTYQKLSNGGTQDNPLTYTYWNTIFGDLTDKYGNRWLLNYSNKSNN